MYLSVLWKSEGMAPGHILNIYPSDCSRQLAHQLVVRIEVIVLLEDYLTSCLVDASVH